MRQRPRRPGASANRDRPPRPDSRSAPASSPADAFVALSAALTGFPAVELWGTGQARSYLEELVRIVGGSVVAELLATGERALSASDPRAELEALIMDDPDLGPVARSVILLWYLGQWSPLPGEWRNRHGASPLDVPHVISADAYASGLIWTAIGAHPMGANPGGYGSWATPPVRAKAPGGAARPAPAPRPMAGG